MDRSLQLANGNGSETAGTLLPLPGAVSLEERILYIEQRVAVLEHEQARFMAAINAAGKFLLSSPQSKMILMALPKEMKTKLQEYFGG